MAGGLCGAWEYRPVVPADIHDFFAASAGVAGALIGLLFVAISVSGGRLGTAAADGQLHRIRAHAALISFNNALAVSLFALIPGQKIGMTCTVVACVGLVFVLAALLSLARARDVRLATVRDAVFLAGLVVVFVCQLVAGLSVISRPDDSGSVNTIAVLVVVCFLIGIARAWELIGGPLIGITSEVAALVRPGDPEAAPPAEAEAPEKPGSPTTGNHSG